MIVAVSYQPQLGDPGSCTVRNWVECSETELADYRARLVAADGPQEENDLRMQFEATFPACHRKLRHYCRETL